MASDLRHFFQKTQKTLKEFQEQLQSRKQEHEKSIQLEPLATASIRESKDTLEITVSAGTIAKFVVLTILLLLITAFLYRIRDVLIIFFVSLLFAAALDPLVDSLERRRIPRALAVVLIYLAVLLAIGLLISSVAPIIATELAQLAGKVQDFISNIVHGDINLPSWMERFRPLFKRSFEGINISQVGNYKEVLLQFAKKLSDVAGNVFNVVLIIFNGFFNTLLVFIITFLMTVDETGIDKFILSLFPARHAEYIRQKSNAIKEKLGYWLRGQVVLCVVVGVLVYLGFLIIGLLTKKVEYAATIALVAGFTELIPYAGPFLAWLIAFPIVANQSIMLIIWMTLLMYLVQMLENNLIVPVVMHKAVGISPIFVIFAMLVGFSFLGIIGMLLAVPVATAVAIFVKDYAEKNK